MSRLDRGLVQLAEVLDRVGGAVRLHYSEAEDLVPLVQELLAAPSPTPTHAMTWTALSQELPTTDPVDGERAEFSAGSAPRYQRQNLDDGIALGAGAVGAAGCPDHRRGPHR
ncbi:hypothetical protein AB0E44_13800 [Micrococcus terreus]|uniref:hypothetical protein n=1 Tax=Micrococcus terreus TaxID=574650 RepID=UPI003404443D